MAHLLKKIRDMKRTFHAKMGTIKDRNGKDLIEAEEIQKRWQAYNRRTIQKNVLTTWITTMVRSQIWSQTSWSVKSSVP